jgi:hypothetical protein
MHTLIVAMVLMCGQHTVGTFSWQQGNHYPSFMLLSIAPNSVGALSLENVVATRLCFLPVQLAIYIWYYSYSSTLKDRGYVIRDTE